ncbi:hypothetical protein B0A49_13644 [Cryomyces minteri]|uniref:Uncharacterized protein n=1 Tax=Cryomyces minteri TaxID=331657 RepID=A0A4U0UYC2_9PEZI|nr:hypothetical protein B0A49_13644 [Cryomyces minteri]
MIKTFLDGRNKKQSDHDDDSSIKERMKKGATHEAFINSNITITKIPFSLPLAIYHCKTPNAADKPAWCHPKTRQLISLASLPVVPFAFTRSRAPSRRITASWIRYPVSSAVMAFAKAERVVMSVELLAGDGVAAAAGGGWEVHSAELRWSSWSDRTVTSVQWAAEMALRDWEKLGWSIIHPIRMSSECTPDVMDPT